MFFFSNFLIGQLSPGFTAPTNSNFDPNLSLASTISSKASFVLKSNNSYPDKPRRTILIASSILQKVTYALQNLIKGEYKNVLKRTKTSFRHYYLQLMNLPHKHIQEVLDLFSIFEDGATSLAEGQHSSMHQAKDSNNLITFPHPLGRNNRACGTEQSSAVSAMKEYESVIENFLVSYLLILANVAFVMLDLVAIDILYVLYTIVPASAEPKFI